MRHLVLASASPRRRDILAQLGLAFEVMAAEVEEQEAGEPEAAARANAERKARAVAERRHDAAAVLGADTVVALDERILPKPHDEGQARQWLELLSGREHRVISALCLVESDRMRSATSCTLVRLRRLTPAEIEWYVAGGEWRGKAGGYAIQGRGAALIASIEGDYWTVVGLPVPALLDLLGPEVLLSHGDPT